MLCSTDDPVCSEPLYGAGTGSCTVGGRVAASKSIAGDLGARGVSGGTVARVTRTV